MIVPPIFGPCLLSLQVLFCNVWCNPGTPRLPLADLTMLYARSELVIAAACTRKSFQASSLIRSLFCQSTQKYKDKYVRLIPMHDQSDTHRGGRTTGLTLLLGLRVALWAFAGLAALSICSIVIWPRSQHSQPTSNEEEENQSTWCGPGSMCCPAPCLGL